MNRYQSFTVEAAYDRRGLPEILRNASVNGRFTCESSI